MRQFQLLEMFFSRVKIERAQVVPDPLMLDMRLEVQLGLEPRLFTVLFDAKSYGGADTQPPVPIDLQVVGKFGLTESEREPLTISEASEFLEAKGILLLIPFVDQMMRQVTAVMGMRPVALNMPPDLFSLRIGEPNQIQQPDA